MEAWREHVGTNNITVLKYRQAAQRPSNPSAITSGPPVSSPAMTTADGTIVDFDAANVYKAGVEAGL